MCLVGRQARRRGAIRVSGQGTFVDKGAIQRADNAEVKTVKLTFKGKGKKTILETMETMRREAETRGGGMGTVGPAGRRRKAQAGERLRTLKASGTLRFTWEARTRGRVSVREAEVCWD